MTAQPIPQSTTAIDGLFWSQASVDLVAAVRHLQQVGLPHTAMGSQSATVKTVLTEALQVPLRPWQVIHAHGRKLSVVGYSETALALRAFALPSLAEAVSIIGSTPIPSVRVGTELTLSSAVVATINGSAQGCGRDNDVLYHLRRKWDRPDLSAEEAISHYIAGRPEFAAAVEIQRVELVNREFSDGARKSAKSSIGWAKHSHPVYTVRVRCEVVNEGGFRQLLAHGTGRQKAFGYGCWRVSL
ncbi:MAG: hypothetical protein ACE368_22575 [Paracoccaceae bacterium]